MSSKKVDTQELYVEKKTVGKEEVLVLGQAEAVPRPNLSKTHGVGSEKKNAHGSSEQDEPVLLLTRKSSSRSKSKTDDVLLLNQTLDGFPKRKETPKASKIELRETVLKKPKLNKKNIRNTLELNATNGKQSQVNIDQGFDASKHIVSLSDVGARTENPSSQEILPPLLSSEKAAESLKSSSPSVGSLLNQVVLANVGLSQSSHSVESKTTSLLGTLETSPPEILQSKADWSERGKFPIGSLTINGYEHSSELTQDRLLMAEALGLEHPEENVALPIEPLESDALFPSGEFSASSESSKLLVPAGYSLERIESVEPVVSSGTSSLEAIQLTRSSSLVTAIGSSGRQKTMPLQAFEVQEDQAVNPNTFESTFQRPQKTKHKSKKSKPSGFFGASEALKSSTLSFTEIFQKLRSQIAGELPFILNLRHELHQNPELSYQEFETTKRVEESIQGLNIRIKQARDGLGLIIDSGPESDKRIAIRADMDALAIQEETSLDSASVNAGIMHACGHDVHTACLVGVVRTLSRLAPELPFRYIFQPAEEVTPGGALTMIEQGALEGVSKIIALHCDPSQPVGQISLKLGAMTAAKDEFHVTLFGHGGHGARPHETQDLILATCQIIQSLYQAFDRRLDTREPFVISVGVIQGGDKSPNVLPSSVSFSGTARSVTSETRDKVESIMRQVLSGSCAAHDIHFELEMRRGAPAVVNDDSIIEAFRQTAVSILGDDGYTLCSIPSMGAEDFAHYLDYVPGAMFRLGTGIGNPLHSSYFVADDSALAVGIHMLCHAAVSLAKSNNELSK